MAGILTRRHELPVVPASSPVERLRVVIRPINAVSVGVTLLTGVASLGLYTYITPVLQHTTLRHHLTLGIWVWGLGGAIGALLVGRVIDATGKPLQLSLGLLIGLSVAVFGMRISDITFVVVGALFLWGLCGWASLAPQQHTLLETNPSDGATAVAANASANYLGSSVGALVGSLVIATVGTDGLIDVMGTVALVAIILQGFRLRLARTP